MEFPEDQINKLEAVKETKETQTLDKPEYQIMKNFT